MVTVEAEPGTLVVEANSTRESVPAVAGLSVSDMRVRFVTLGASCIEACDAIKRGDAPGELALVATPATSPWWAQLLQAELPRRLTVSAKPHVHELCVVDLTKDALDVQVLSELFVPLLLMQLGGAWRAVIPQTLDLRLSSDLEPEAASRLAAAAADGWPGPVKVSRANATWRVRYWGPALFRVALLAGATVAVAGGTSQLLSMGQKVSAYMLLLSLGALVLLLRPRLRRAKRRYWTRLFKERLGAHEGGAA